MRVSARMQLIYAVRDLLGSWDTFNEVNPDTLTNAKREQLRREFEGKVETLRAAMDRLR